MAHGNRSSEELSREQQLAVTLIDRFGLKPPVQVREVTRKFADLEETPIPGACDGLAIGLGRRRPRIIVAPTENWTRQRFTFAHELGHVLLPWHTGTNLACLTTDFDNEDYAVSSAEAEANRFAAELLVPTRWLREIVAAVGATDIRRLLNEVQKAEVSAHVACLRLASALPPGFGFVVLGDARLVALAGHSPGMNLPLPKRWSSLDANALDQMAVSREIVRYGSRTVIWWNFHEAPVTTGVDASRNSKDVLAEIVARHAGDERERKRTYGTISSVIGAANSEAGREGRTSPEALHARFRSRFAVPRSLPSGLLQDPEFATWLERRACELAR